MTPLAELLSQQDLKSVDRIESFFIFNPLYTLLPTLANSEDPDEMPHYVAYYQGLSTMFAKTQNIIS